MIYTNTPRRQCTQSGSERGGRRYVSGGIGRRRHGPPVFLNTHQPGALWRSERKGLLVFFNTNATRCACVGSSPHEAERTTIAHPHQSRRSLHVVHRLANAHAAALLSTGLRSQATHGPRCGLGPGPLSGGLGGTGLPVLGGRQDWSGLRTPVRHLLED